MSAAAASSAWARAPEDRVGLIATLANLPAHPECVPINLLVQVEGTPLRGRKPLDPLDFVRTIAVARIPMPKSVVRLSAGREDMSDETQALCFLAGANSIFYGPKLLTTPNPERDRDLRLLDRLGPHPDDLRQDRGGDHREPDDADQPDRGAQIDRCPRGSTAN